MNALHVVIGLVFLAVFIGAIAGMLTPVCGKRQILNDVFPVKDREFWGDGGSDANHDECRAIADAAIAGMKDESFYSDPKGTVARARAPFKTDG